MNKNVERAKELLPAVILTILSMIQALALELFWTRVVETELLWQGGFTAILGWMQAGAVFLGIMLIWLFHVSFVLRFTWLPSLEDMVVPFFIGVLEFGMIDLMEPDFLAPWMLLLAALFALSTTASHFTMRRARREPENAYFFSTISPAGLRDYLYSIAVVTALALFGVLLYFFDDNRLLAAVALTLALAALSFQLMRSKQYWMHSLRPDQPPIESDANKPPGE